MVPALRVFVIEPGVAKWGQDAKIIGLGLDTTLLEGLTMAGKPAQVVAYTPAIRGNPNSVDTLRFRVPALAPPVSEVVIKRFDATVSRPLGALQEDILEPNDIAPALLPAAFANGDLALEAKGGRDWYRVRSGAVTVRVSPSGSGALGLSVRQPQPDPSAPPVWAIGAGAAGQYCRGIPITTKRSTAPGPLAVTFANAAGDSLDIVVTGDGGAEAVQYGLELKTGAAVQLPDSSKNASCDHADPLPWNAVTTAVFRTADDIDWYRFTTDTTTAFAVALGTDSGAAPHVLVLRDDALLTLMVGAFDGAGTRAAFTLDPGAYLVIVWSGQRVPGRYSLVTYSGLVPGPPLTEISAGWDRTCALGVLREVWCWGAGPVGDGSTDNSAVPRRVAALSLFRKVAAGGSHACGLIGDPQDVWCWGRNAFGQLGNGKTTEGIVPARISRAANDPVRVTGIAIGWGYSCVAGDFQAGRFFQSSMRTWCWGQFNEGPPTMAPVLHEIQAVGVASIAADSGHGCALFDVGVLNAPPDSTGPGEVRCWGGNQFGQRGAATEWSPVRGLPPMVAVSAGGNGVGAHTCGLDQTRTAWCWGANGRGQIGTGTTAASVPVPAVVGGNITWSEINAGGLHTCGLDAGGNAYCWGDNSRGQVGDGTTADRHLPTPVAGGRTFRSISAGNYHTCGITMDGAAYCWGTGPLGVDAVSSSPTPVLVVFP